MKDSVRTFLLVALVAGLGYMFFIRKPERPPGSHVQTIEAPTQNRPQAQTLRLTTPRSTAQSSLELAVSTRSGGVTALRLNGAQWRMPGQRGDARLNLTTTEREEYLPLRLDVRLRRGPSTSESVVPAFVDFQQARQVSDHEIELTWQGNDVEVVRTLHAVRPFTIDVSTRVTNRGAPGTLEHRIPVYHWVTRADEAGKFFQRPWQLSEAMCRHGDELWREGREKLQERAAESVFAGNANFAAIGNLYFAMALAPRGNAEAQCRLWALDLPNADEAAGSVYHASIGWAAQPIGTGETRPFEATVFFGPKDAHVLAQAAPDGRLRDVQNLGFFSFIARGLMRFLAFLQGLVKNWGVAIILLTVCIRILLLPLLHKSMKSMVGMQILKPELDEINRKFEANPEAKMMATMELYRRHGVSPWTGCLPQFAQLPIWWALYTTLQTSVELFHAPFALWLRDLSAPDPFYVLPLLLGGFMILQSRLFPPQGMDPVQAKMMTWFLPIFLTGISLFLPAGLALYMLVNSVLGIFQQWYTKRTMDRAKAGMGGGGSGDIQIRPAS